MSRQLNLRVSDEFVEKLERVARELGRPMGAVLESIGRPGLEAMEADLEFEADALAAWEAWEMSGERVGAETVDGLFSKSLSRAKAVEESRRR